MKSSPLPPDLADPLTRSVDRLGRFGRQILFYDTVGSTNDVAASLAEGGAPEGCLVVSDAQTAGRGRLGRQWSSPPGAGLYVSIVLKPDRDVAPMLTIAAGVAIAEGIVSATGLVPDLKWPNDVFIAGRKVAGILAEGTPRFVILGFGINVLPAAYPPEIASRATSLERELGRAIDRGTLLVECLSAFAQAYRTLRGGSAAFVVEAWRARAAGTLGRRVRCDGKEGSIDGVVAGIDAGGALLLRTDSGVLRVISGEVTWL